jgi:hypothetical protein
VGPFLPRFYLSDADYQHDNARWRSLFNSKFQFRVESMYPRFYAPELFYFTQPIELFLSVALAGSFQDVILFVEMCCLNKIARSGYRKNTEFCRVDGKI